MKTFSQTVLTVIYWSSKSRLKLKYFELMWFEFIKSPCLLLLLLELFHHGAKIAVDKLSNSNFIGHNREKNRPAIWEKSSIKKEDENDNKFSVDTRFPASLKTESAARYFGWHEVISFQSTVKHRSHCVALQATAATSSIHFEFID